MFERMFEGKLMRVRGDRDGGGSEGGLRHTHLCACESRNTCGGWRVLSVVARGVETGLAITEALHCPNSAHRHPHTCN
jgi:hypothetical protein